MPESLFRQDHINIADVAIEQQKPKLELNFVPEQEVSQKDWELAKEALHTLIGFGNQYVEASWLAKNLLTLFPDRRDELELTDAFWLNLKTTVQEIRDQNPVAERDLNNPQNWSWDMAEALLAAKWLFPQRYHELNITSSDMPLTFKGNLAQAINDLLGVASGSHCADLLLASKLIFPDSLPPDAAKDF